jgi:ABC-type proline/glycine betaine transport system ATPase subunit
MMIPLVNDVTKCVVQEGHVKAEAVALAHRIAIMQKGRSEQVGTAEALRSEPVTEAGITLICPIRNRSLSLEVSETTIKLR